MLEAPPEEVLADEVADLARTVTALVVVRSGGRRGDPATLAREVLREPADAMDDAAQAAVETVLEVLGVRPSVPEGLAEAVELAGRLASALIDLRRQPTLGEVQADLAAAIEWSLLGRLDAGTALRAAGALRDARAALVPA